MRTFILEGGIKVKAIYIGWYVLFVVVGIKVGFKRIIFHWISPIWKKQIHLSKGKGQKSSDINIDNVTTKDRKNLRDMER